MFRIAHNEAISLFRRNKRLVDEEVPEASEGGSVRVAGAAVYPAELSLAVERALDLLTPEQRETVVLKVYHGFKFDEVAEIVSCPVSTVKSRLYSAFEALKGTLAPAAKPSV